MSKVVTDPIFNKEPGMGLNANPFEGEMHIDLTAPMGALSGLYYGLMFQLGKVGFATYKIEETIDVTPVFKQYYDLTIQQKQALEAQVKAGLGQIATSIHDYELIWHDLRKYKEFMDYYTKIEQGNKLAKSKDKKEKEEGEKLKKEGLQLLRSVFIDQVDAHTGEGIALRTITQRWPTIIVDFMRLDDSDTDQRKLAERYHITEAEGAVLSTKNKLFIEWRDNLFKPTLSDRYKQILRLVEARKTSIEQYTEMLKPVIGRYKLINDALEKPEGRTFGLTTFFQPGAQAYSLDYSRIWSFMPFAPAEKYKVTRDYLDEIPLSRTGFTKSEIDEIKNGFERAGDKLPKSVSALPVEPSIDKIVRDSVKKVEKEYNVKLTFKDVFDARNNLVKLFTSRSMQVVGGKNVGHGGTWLFSPYFIFIDMPFLRFVYHSPGGGEFEDLMVDNMTVKNRTQNVIIVTLLEVIAREKQLENYISRLLGEMGVVKTKEGSVLKTIEDMAKDQYPEFFGGERPTEKPKGKEMTEPLKKAQHALGDILSSFGLRFDWLRARGPYEFAMDDRIAEMFQVETMVQGYLYVLRYLQRGVNVPGIRL
ncbi:MAG: hypothetical protein HYW24_00465 [Candidatus Aenigmarchaeota archaeon]|nr:hypothetical protein [Candidatus Aenigmarchaeota archaeon]